MLNSTLALSRYKNPKTGHSTDKIQYTLSRKEFSFHRGTSNLKYYINAERKLAGDSASASANVLLNQITQDTTVAVPKRF